MEKEFLNVILVVCWFLGMGCSLSIYAKIIDYGYMAFINGKKSCLIMAISGVLFGSYVNVITNFIAIEIGFSKDFVNVFFYLIVFICYLLLFCKLIIEYEKPYKFMLQLILFLVTMMGVRPVCIFSIEKLMSMKENMPNSWLIECIVWCFLIERFVLVIENKLRVIKVKKYEENVGRC